MTGTTVFPVDCLGVLDKAGLTKRELFAAMATFRIMPTGEHLQSYSIADVEQYASIWAQKGDIVANAILKQLEKP